MQSRSKKKIFSTGDENPRFRETFASVFVDAFHMQPEPVARAYGASTRSHTCHVELGLLP
jgi:hypothetical protein